jgi:hypothetical protein
LPATGRCLRVRQHRLHSPDCVESVNPERHLGHLYHNLMIAHYCLHKLLATVLQHSSAHLHVLGFLDMWCSPQPLPPTSIALMIVPSLAPALRIYLLLGCSIHVRILATATAKCFVALQRGMLFCYTGTSSHASCNMLPSTAAFLPPRL